jgi:hypothetical protein
MALEIDLIVPWHAIRLCRRRGPALRRVRAARSGRERPAPDRASERYRALTDQYDRLTDISEQGDRKTRFALLILGSINAVNLLIVTGGNLSGGSQPSCR